MKKYLRAIKRRLNMPMDLRKRVMNDLLSSIISRREAGQSDEQIMKELGAPKQVAADLNRQMEEYTYRKSPWRWGCLILMIFGILSLIFQGTLGMLAALFSLQTNHSIGIIGGADGPTSIFISAPAEHFMEQTVIAVVLLLMGAIGFWALSHMKRK